MPNGVHPSVKGVEPARSDPVPDRPCPHPERQELAPSNDPVLPSRQPGDQLVGGKWDGFGPYSGYNPSRLAHAADDRDASVTELPFSVTIYTPVTPPTP